MATINSELKVQNTIAHLAVLKSETKTQEATLGSIVVQRKEEEAKLSALKSEIAEAQLTLNKKIELAQVESNRILRALESLEKKESQISEREMSLFAKEENFDEFVVVTTKKLDSEKAELIEEINKLTETKESKEKELASFEKYYTDRLNELTNSVIIKAQELEKVESEASEAVSTLSEAQKSLESVLKAKEVAETDLKETIEKKADFLKNLEERSKKLATQEKDSRVIINRIIRKHDELFPDRKLTI